MKPWQEVYLEVTLLNLQVFMAWQSSHGKRVKKILRYETEDSP